MLRDRIGNVREARGALVRRHHQVGVVAIVAHHLGRRDDLLVDDVVGEVEQTADQGLVAVDDLGRLCLAVADQRAPDDESALGAHRHDHGVLHLLRLHQSEHFRAEILAPVGPANPAARDVAHAQMDALHARREHEDFEQRLGQRQFAQLLTFELERQMILEPVDGGALVGIGAHGRGQGAPERAQDAVIVGPLDLLHGGADAKVEPGERAAAARRRQRGVEAGGEQVGKGVRQHRIGDQHLGDVALAERQTCLQQIAAVGTQHSHGAPGHAGGQRELVEAVVVHASGPHRGERVFDLALQRVELDDRRRAHDQLEVLDPGAPAAREFQLIRAFRDDLEAHVLEHGQEVGYRDRILTAENLQKKFVLAPWLRTIDVEMQPLGVLLHRVEKRNVVRGGLAGKVLGVGRGKRRRIDAEQLEGAGFVEAREQRALETVRPGADRCGHQQFEGVGLDALGLVGQRAGDQMDARQVRFGDLHLQLDARGVEGSADHRFDALSHDRVVFFARHEHQAGIETPERIAAQQQPHPGPFLQPENAGHHLDEFRHAGLEQLVAGKGLEDVLQRLAVVAVGRQRKVLDELGDLVAHQGDLARVGAVSGRGPQPEEAAFADQLTLGAELLDADVVEIAGPMHRRLEVRLGDQGEDPGTALPTDVACEDPPGALGMLVARTQDAEAGGLDGFQRLVAGRAAQPVFAVAQEGEMTALHPGQQGLGFADVARVEARRRRVQIVRGLMGGGAHFCPVQPGRANVAQTAFDLGLQRLQGRGIDYPIDLDVLKGFESRLAGAGRRPALLQRLEQAVGGPLDGKDRMRQKMQGERALGQRQPDRVDQERHVVVDHFDHGVLRHVTVLAQRGIEDAHQRAAAALPREGELRQREQRELAGFALREVGHLDVGVVRAQIRLGRCTLERAAQRLGQPRGGGHHGAHDPAMLIRKRLVHVNSQPQSALLFVI